MAPLGVIWVPLGTRLQVYRLSIQTLVFVYTKSVVTIPLREVKANDHVNADYHHYGKGKTIKIEGNMSNNFSWTTTITRFLIAGGVIGIIAVVVMASGITDYKEWVSFVTVNVLSIFAFVTVTVGALTALATKDVMERQELEMIEQRKAMQEQLNVMRLSFAQTDKMFYEANRAYIGVESVGVYDADTGKKGFPASGKFVVVSSVVNKGRTPALHLRNAAGGAFLGRSVPREEWPPPDFDLVPPGRPVPQILPEQVSPIYGDEQEIHRDVAAKIISGDMIFIVSTKFEFNCLGVKDEDFVVHHIWDHNRDVFVESAVWPPDVKLANQDKNAYD